MKPTDRQMYISRYQDRLRRHGTGRRALGWSDPVPDWRFHVLAEPVLHRGRSSVLDVGCGFGDLYGYLRRYAWAGEYLGLDLVSDLLAVARDRYPDIEVKEEDFAESDMQGNSYDFVVASGIFNSVLTEGGNTAHVESTLSRMFEVAREAVCVDFLSTERDVYHEGIWYTDPQWIFSVCSQLSRRLVLRHDYMRGEFAVLLYKNVLVDHGCYYQLSR